MNDDLYDDLLGPALESYVAEEQRLSQLAELDLDALSDPEREELLASLTDRERFMLDIDSDRLEPEPARPVNPAAVVAPTPRWWWGVGAISALAALVFWLSVPRRPALVQGDDAGVVVKGPDATKSSFKLHVSVERDGRQGQLRSGDFVRSGERFGLHVSAPANGFVGVYFIESGVAPTRMFPRSGDGVIKRGARQRLAAGGTLTSTDEPCEWVIGVFSRAPIGAAALEARLAKAIADSACTLKVELPEGLHADIITLRRQETPK